jgi:ABC-2 type transport system permease protein
VSRIPAIFIAVTRNWLRSRSGLFFTILFPLMLLLVFGAVFSGSSTASYSIQIQNRDVTPNGSPSTLSLAFISTLNQTKTLSISSIPASADPRTYAQSKANFFGSQSNRILVIPEGFQNNLLNGTTKVRLIVTSTTLSFLAKNFSQFISPSQRQGIETGIAALNSTAAAFPGGNVSLLYYSDPSDSGGQIVKQIVATVANSFNYRLIGATPIITFSDQSLVVKRLNSVDYYVPGLIGAFVMSNGVIGLTSVATEFKRRGVLKRLSATPLSRFEWIVGNILSQTVLAVALTVVMILAGRLIFGATTTIDFYSAIIIFAGAVLFSGIGMLLAGLVKDPEAATGLGNAIAFPMMFLSGSFWPIDIMPSYLQSFARVLPLFYFSDGLRAAMVTGNTVIALSDFVVIGVLAIVFILLGSFVTSWHEK